MVDAGFQAELQVLLNDFASKITDIGIANTRVILTLRIRVTILRPTQRAFVLEEEVFLLQSKPGFFIIKDGGTVVGWMRSGAIGHHDFAHNEESVVTRSIRIKGDGFQHAIRAATFGLLGGAAIKSPHGTILYGIGSFADDFGFPTQIGDGSVAVEPDVFEFVLGHI
jgi:hypothetical protein